MLYEQPELRDVDGSASEIHDLFSACQNSSLTMIVALLATLTNDIPVARFKRRIQEGNSLGGSVEARNARVQALNVIGEVHQSAAPVHHFVEYVFVGRFAGSNCCFHCCSTYRLLHIGCLWTVPE